MFILPEMFTSSSEFMHVPKALVQTQAGVSLALSQEKSVAHGCSSALKRKVEESKYNVLDMKQNTAS